MTGLPPEYETDEAIDVQVAGAATVLRYDAADKVHRMVVPVVAPGEAELVVPASASGGRDLRARFQVLPAQYVGGSPGAALAEMDQLLDSLQVQASLAMRHFSQDDDPLVTARLDALVSLTEAVQTSTDALSPQDQAAVAAFYSESAPMVRDMAGFLSQLVGGMADLPPTLGARSSVVLLQQTPRSASQMVQRCVDHEALLKRLKDFQTYATWISGSAVVITALASGPAALALAAVVAKTLVILDATVLLVSAQPLFLDDDGLRLQSSVSRVRHDGGTATMSALVRRQSSGDVLTGAASVGIGLRDTQQAFKAILKMREDLTNQEAFWDLFGDFLMGQRLSNLLDGIASVLDEAVREASGSLWGEVPVTFDGISVTANSQPARWRFTGGAGSADRAFETVGRNTQPVEPVTLAAAMGTAEHCRAATAGSDPASGRNGFEIAAEASVRFGAASSVSVPAGSSGTLRVPVTNEGGQPASAITYRLAAGAAWTPPSWLSVGTPSGPSALQPQQSGTLSISVRPTPNAPQQSVIIPVEALVAGKVTATTTLAVTVTPQLSDVVVNADRSTIRLWDHATQDGDRVTVTLNGAPLATDLTLTNAGTTFPVTYRQGRNVLVIRALNEGSLIPNTAAVGFANVVSGLTTQTYSLNTGGTVQLTITYAPGAQPASADYRGVLPAANLTPCGLEGKPGCRP